MTSGEIFGVYSIKNTTNGKVYIGYSRCIYKRWKTHINKLKCVSHENKNLQDDWILYGEESFDFEVEYIIDIRYKTTESEIKCLGMYFEGIFMEKYKDLYNILPKYLGNKEGVIINFEKDIFEFIKKLESNNHIVKFKNMAIVKKFTQTSTSTEPKILTGTSTSISHVIKIENLKTSYSDVIECLKLKNIIDDNLNVNNTNDILYNHNYGDRIGIRIYNESIDKFKTLISEII